MENSTINGYVRKYPQVDRIELVSEFISNLVTSRQTLDIAAMGCGRRPSLPPLVRDCTWQLEGRKYLWLLFRGFSVSHILIPLDLKVNVLIDKNGHARLTDFGLISFSREDTSVGSPQDMKTAGATTWAAPEILRGGAVTKEGDVFTFAMVAVEVCVQGS